MDTHTLSSANGRLTEKSLTAIAVVAVVGLMIVGCVNEQDEWLLMTYS